MDNNAIEAAVMRRFLQHLDTRKDVQNIQLMTLAGFCRNCLSKWYKSAAEEQGVQIDDAAAREWAYGMTYDQWKNEYQLDTSAHEMALFNQQQALQKDMAEFRERLASKENAFSETLALVEKWYDLKPTAFKNGLDEQAVQNQQGQNEGSLKVFALGRLNGFTPEQALASFGEHYRDVLATPDGNDHQNIRQFMRHGWAGIQFEQAPLTLKAVEA
ncbi:MAG: HopJ type III effector protein [Gammaproteobacteria bacterium]|nr:HopJ type III effector protein [Gammaproteobacteria bacterium]